MYDAVILRLGGIDDAVPLNTCSEVKLKCSGHEVDVAAQYAICVYKSMTKCHKAKFATCYLLFCVYQAFTIRCDDNRIMNKCVRENLMTLQLIGQNFNIIFTSTGKIFICLLYCQLLRVLSVR